MQISDLLNIGEGNEMTEQYLSSLTGMRGAEIRAAVHRERLEGVPIISNSHGYFLAQNEHEKRAFVQSMRQRAAAIMRAADGVERGGQSVRE